MCIPPWSPKRTTGAGRGGAVLNKLYGGSLKTFAAALWDGGKLSRDEVSELQNYLEALTREGP